MTPVNALRGDVPLTIGEETYRLRLTLGALAEIEGALGTEDLAALTTRLGKPSARDMLVILAALLKGGGNAMGLEELRARSFDVKVAMAAVARAFALGVGGPGDGEAPGKS